MIISISEKDLKSNAYMEIEIIFFIVLNVIFGIQDQISIIFTVLNAINAMLAAKINYFTAINATFATNNKLNIAFYVENVAMSNKNTIVVFAVLALVISTKISI